MCPGEGIWFLSSFTNGSGANLMLPSDAVVGPACAGKPGPLVPL